jgi:hypothetical protein
MSDKPFILCRNDIGWPMNPKTYCSKPIIEKNIFDWCPEHLARLPYWPTGD